MDAVKRALQYTLEAAGYDTLWVRKKEDSETIRFTVCAERPEDEARDDVA